MLVFVNGCFDGLHPGHLWFLEEAAKFGALTVGLNSDCSVRRRKGPGRPIYDQERRAEDLLATGLVYAVWLFDDDNATGLVAELKPDILVKGEEWRGCPEAALVESYGGAVVWLPRRGDWSTTGMRNRK